MESEACNNRDEDRILPSNNLRVIYNPRCVLVTTLHNVHPCPRSPDDTSRRGIAVCSKGLSLRSDSSLRLVEWVEVLRSLGADTILLYTYQIHPNVAKVLTLLKLDCTVVTAVGRCWSTTAPWVWWRCRPPR